MYTAPFDKRSNLAETAGVVSVKYFQNTLCTFRSLKLTSVGSGIYTKKQLIFHARFDDSSEILVHL